jgi:molybdopterin molybdotransferase
MNIASENTARISTLRKKKDCWILSNKRPEHNQIRPLPVDVAIQKVLEHTPVKGTMITPLTDCFGHILAENLVADIPIPPFAKSMMDGYAIRSEDVEVASFTAPVQLNVVDTVLAGDVSSCILQPGEAIRIMTGAKIPEGADAVCRFEQTKEGFELVERVSVLTPIRSGEAIAKCGEDMQQGSTILQKGTEIGPAEGSILATFGVTDVLVYKRPIVGIVSTGSELVDVTCKTSAIPPGKIRNSNSTLVAQLVQKYGGQPHIIPHSEDSVETLKERFDMLLDTADILVFTGGVSVGDKDYIPQFLMDSGVNIVFWKVLIRPGQPVLFGKYDNKLIFGLSGNPAACFVNALLFLIPAIRRMSGIPLDKALLPIVEARLVGEINKNPIKHTRFLRATVYIQNGNVYADVQRAQSSAVLSSFLNTNCLVRIDSDCILHEGDIVRCMLYGQVGETYLG